MLTQFYLAILFSIAAFVMNTVEIILLLRKKRRRSNYQNIVLSLAFADLLVVLFYSISFVYKTFLAKEDQTVQMETFSMISYESLWFSVTSSLFHVVVISFDRFLSVRSPSQHRLWLTRRKSSIILTITWVLSLLFISPAFFINISKRRILHTITAVLVIASGTIISAIYVYIVRKTVSKQCVMAVIRVAGGKREVVSACSPKEKKIMFMSFSIVVSFLVCNFPFAIVFIAAGAKSYTNLLLISNSCINPIIYFFRKHFRDKKLKQSHGMAATTESRL